MCACIKTPLQVLSLQSRVISEAPSQLPWIHALLSVREPPKHALLHTPSSHFDHIGSET